MAGEELAKVLSSASTCVVPVLELKKMRAFSFFFSSSRFLKRSDDRHSESRMAENIVEQQKKVVTI